jgi:hypothetical protein
LEIPCPKCGQPVELKSADFGSDEAFCEKCRLVFGIPLPYGQKQLLSFDENSPPAGAWFRRTADGFEAGATTRTLMAIPSTLFTVLWSGLTLYGIYGIQFVEGQYDTIWSLLGIPFILISLLLCAESIMLVCGKVTVRAAGDRGEIFVGCGRFGIHKYFDWPAVSSIVEESHNKKHIYSPNLMRIAVKEKKTVRFGMMLKEDRRQFIVGVLNKMLAEHNLSKSG